MERASEVKTKASGLAGKCDFFAHTSSTCVTAGRYDVPAKPHHESHSSSQSKTKANIAAHVSASQKAVAGASGEPKAL
jgi:hypothetical protein